jgi:hypothetical protein
MADFIAFDEGLDELAADGLPATCWFGLSTKSVDGTNPYVAGQTLAGSGEITGTDYDRISEAEPAPAAGVIEFAELVWETLAETDWSSTTRSVFMADTEDNTGKLICAWNLQDGGVARDLSGANTTERFTPTLNLQNVA